MADSIGVAAGVVFAAVLVGGGIIGTLSYTTVATQTCTVVDKDRVADRDGKSNMRVYTSDCGVFEVRDSLIDGLWNSSDLYSSIQEDGRYTLTARGLRIPFFSMFPNIIKAVPA